MSSDGIKLSTLKKVNNKLLSKHRIEVEAYFQGGCYWFEELSFWFIHL